MSDPTATTSRSADGDLPPVSATPLFEAELRRQLEAARRVLAEALDATDDLLAAAARNRISNLLTLAGRNGVELPDAGSGAVVDLTTTAEPTSQPLPQAS